MTMFLEPLIGIDQTILFTMELAAGNDRQSSQCMMSLVIGYFRVSEYPGQSWKCPPLPVRLMRTGVSSRRDIPVCNAVPMLLAWAARRPSGLRFHLSVRYLSTLVWSKRVALTSRFTHGDTRIAGTRRPY